MSPASDFAAWGRRTRKLQAAAIAAAAAALFVWVAASSITKPAVVSPPHSAVATGAETDLYPLLARGFLKGRLSLDADVPASLARESDPYDPGRLSAPHLHDASYYRGKYYAYFGPAPALTLFLPYRILAGRDLPSPAAVTFFCLGCYAGMIALFAAAAGDRANQCPFSLVPAVLLALGGTSFLLPLLRRPAFYEVAIAAGSCFLLWSFFFLARLRATARPVLCSCLCGLLLGLATASRPTTAFGFAPLAAGIFLLNRRRSRPGKTADLAAAGAAFGAIVGLLGLYNYLRFGSPFEFGQKYQLSAATEGSLRHFSFSYLPFQARIYLVSALGHSRYFPFFQPIAPAMLPPGIGGYEYAYGVFANLPVAAFALVPLARALTGAGRENRDIVFVLFGALVVSLAPVLLFFGSCVRYMADFAPVLAVIASLGMVESVDWAGRTGPGAAIWLSRLAAAAAAASFAVAFLASVDMYDSAPATPPPALDRLGNLLNRPVVWWDQAHGIRPGPRRIEVILPAAAAGSEPLITAASPSGNCDSIWLEDMDSHSVRFVFRRDELSPADRSPEIALDYGRPHLIGISMGALLPIRPGEMAHPVPRSTFAALRTWLHLELDGRVVWELPIIPRSERCDEIRVGRSASGRKSAVFSGRILSDAILPARSIALDRPPIGGVALSLNLNPDMAGRSFPLVSTGRAGSGNILLLAVGRGGEVRFGYDHWGKPTLWSGEVEAAKSSPHRLEFWMPSVLGGNPPQPLVVNWDGRRVWIENVPYFPASRNEIFVGRNPLGGTGCEVRLINAQVEDLNLPPPAPAHGL